MDEFLYTDEEKAFIHQVAAWHLEPGRRSAIPHEEVHPFIDTTDPGRFRKFMKRMEHDGVAMIVRRGRLDIAPLPGSVELSRKIKAAENERPDYVKKLLEWARGHRVISGSIILGTAIIFLGTVVEQGRPLIELAIDLLRWVVDLPVW